MKLTKDQLFDQLKAEILNELSYKSSVEKSLASICKILQTNVPHYDWVGFYFSNNQEKMLYLKAFSGEPTEHTAIPFGKGICGQVAVSNQDFLVPDVNAQDNYIACSIAVKSEIVVPLFKNNKNIGQIDIDSHTANAFDESDRLFLHWVNQEVAKILPDTL
ncbi:MAG TPA: GAF domain-containing protein [Flavobacteriales bacterium]|nr:GAF domain-containing protein [Flavobacteriales bacterium]